MNCHSKSFGVLASVQVHILLILLMSLQMFLCTEYLRDCSCWEWKALIDSHVAHMGIPSAVAGLSAPNRLLQGKKKTNKKKKKTPTDWRMSIYCHYYIREKYSSALHKDFLVGWRSQAQRSSKLETWAEN